MPIVLPKQKLAATRINPKILLMYSLPKVGKTRNLAELDNNLLLDLEDGADMYEALRVPIKRTADIDEVIAGIIESGRQNSGKFPYKYLSLDTVDMLEAYCVTSATAKYKRSILGRNFEGDSVLDLPKGLGWYYIREEVTLKIEQLSKVCRHLILTSHVKEKLMVSKGGTETTMRDISLSGKLSDIVCAKADAIGYMYRDMDKLMINFTTSDGAIMGARYPHLQGKTFEFDWSKIFIEEKS